MNGNSEYKNTSSGTADAVTPTGFLNSLATKNGKLLFVVIAYAISLVTGAVGFFSVKVNFSAMIPQFVEFIGAKINAELGEVLSQIRDVAVLIDTIFLGAAFVSLLPALVTATGSLLIYIGAKKEDYTLASVGALLLRIFFTYLTVISSVGIALVTVLVVAVCANEPALSVLAVILGVIAIIPLCIVDNYFSKFAKMFKGLGRSLRTDINVLKVYSLVTVINWIFAIFSIISAVGSIGTNLFAAVNTLLSAVALIIVTTAFSDYKKTFGNPTKENIKAAKEMKL